MARHALGRGRRPPATTRRLVALGLAGALAGMGSVVGFATGPREDPIRISLTRAVFKGVNENDILASLQVWAHAILTERGLNVDPEIRILDSSREAVEAVRAGQVEGLALMLEEYATVPAGLLGGPYFRDEVNGTTREQFVVLAHRESGASTLAGLRGSTLVVHDSVHRVLSGLWLRSRLAGQGLGGMRDHFALVDEAPKLSAAVLAVYFRRRDACLVTREGFDSMAALNPQVAEDLVVVEASPPVVPSLFCFRANMPEEDKATAFREITLLDESATGNQVLRVFRADRMSEVTAEQLERSLALLQEWTRAAGGPPVPPTGSVGFRTIDGP